MGACQLLLPLFMKFTISKANIAKAFVFFYFLWPRSGRAAGALGAVGLVTSKLPSRWLLLFLFPFPLALPWSSSWGSSCRLFFSPPSDLLLPAFCLLHLTLPFSREKIEKLRIEKNEEKGKGEEGFSAYVRTRVPEGNEEFLWFVLFFGWWERTEEIS